MPSALRVLVQRLPSQASAFTRGGLIALLRSFEAFPAYAVTYIPIDWSNVLNSSSEACPACLRANTPRQGSSGRLPEVTRPGEIISFDLWSVRTPSIYGGHRYLFGACCNHSDFGFLIQLKYKSESPDALGSVLKYCASVGVIVIRCHTDNESVFPLGCCS